MIEEAAGLEKNKLMMISILALLVILLGTIIGVSLYVFKMIHADNAHASAPTENEARLTLDQIQKVPLSAPISTNLMQDADGSNHYVKLDLAVGVNSTIKDESPEMVESLANNQMVTRDIILSILRHTTFDDLSKPEGQELLKSDIKTKLQEEYNSNLIVQIYISDLALS
jgi:flagellar basal body-associated protein FliL